MAFTPGGHTLTVVADREEMSANAGRDTIFDWHVTGSGALGTVTVVTRDVADFQPFIAPGDRAVLGSPPDSHAWHAWGLPDAWPRQVICTAHEHARPTPWSFRFDRAAVGSVRTCVV